MSTKKTGGPAFPSHGSIGEVVQEGMTLRDYFAAKAMQGLLATGATYGGKTNNRDALAADAFATADAMIKAMDA